jgi:DNA helicase-2/ATP-dependent DNA helicase PcrA
MQVGKQLFSSNSVSIQTSANFVAGDNDLLIEGDEVEHQRFGKGQVLKLEDSGENKKAIINFTQAGQKTLVLKFAKLMKI